MGKPHLSTDWKLHKNDIKEGVQCFQKIKKIDGFTLKDRKLYLEAIKYLGVFIQHFQKVIDDPAFDVSIVLTVKDADAIVNGYAQLQRLLPSDKNKIILLSARSDITSFYGKILEFNRDFRNNEKCHSIIDAIQNKMNISLRPDQGTRRQKILISHLKYECEKYRKHLNIEMKRKPEESSLIDETLDSSLAAKKFNKVQNLISILTDNTQSAADRINTFKVNFNGYKEEVSKHRDDPFMQFIKNLGFVLSSLFLGAGLFYSKFSKDSYNFTQSHGKILSEKLQTELDKDCYTVSEFVRME